MFQCFDLNVIKYELMLYTTYELMLQDIERSNGTSSADSFYDTVSHIQVKIHVVYVVLPTCKVFQIEIILIEHVS